MPADCPSWCAIDHELDLDTDGMRSHCRAFGRFVEVSACDDLETGTRSTASIVVLTVELDTAAAARELALAILDAGDLLEEANR